MEKKPQGDEHRPMQKRGHGAELISPRRKAHPGYRDRSGWR